MARPGITYPEVAHAATQLIEQKVRPSIEAIRRILGTGSNSTISRHLREWIKTQGVQAELEQGLPDSLLIAVRGIYDGMREQATSQLTKMTAEKDQMVSHLKTSMDLLETKQAQLTQEKVSLQTTVNQERQERSALERQLENKKQESDKQAADNHLLMERLSDKHAEIEQLNQLLKHTQSNLDHYRETLRQERLSDKQTFEEKIAVLENQRHLQQGQTSEAREEIARLKQHIESLESTQKTVLKAEKEALEKTQCYENDLQTSQFKLAQLEQVHDQLLLDHQRLTKGTDSDKVKLNELTIKTEKQNERIGLQDIALQKAEDSLKSLADKHLFLTEEKTKLAFQLQQMLEIS